MESSSLNASHRYARQANKFFQSARFDEAILNHEMARKKIEEAMQFVTMPRVLESLRLQRDFHTKQIDLIIIRREQHEKCLAAQAIVDQGMTFRANMEDSRQVQVKLFKSLDDAEKVVEVLEQKTLTSANREASELLSKLFEDLKLLNQQNLVYVNSLVTQLEERITENDTLRELLERTGKQTGDSGRPGSVEKGRSRELTDSDPELNKLDELAPLELPTFDFNTFNTGIGEDGGEGEKCDGTETLRRIGFENLHGNEVGE